MSFHVQESFIIHQVLPKQLFNYTKKFWQYIIQLCTKIRHLEDGNT